MNEGITKSMAEKYAKKLAIGFAEWIEAEGYEYNNEAKYWYSLYEPDNDRFYRSSEQIFNLYLQTIK